MMPFDQDHQPDIVRRANLIITHASIQQAKDDAWVKRTIHHAERNRRRIQYAWLILGVAAVIIIVGLTVAAGA